MKELTIVFPFFMNLGMLAEQQRVWMDYPPDLRAKLHVIVVDDCSPKGHRLGWSAINATGLGSMRLFRLLKKIRWNWLACRNLGADQAQTEWLILTDIDHVFPASTLHRIMANELERNAAYRFGRVTTDRCWPYDLRQLPYYKPHNDTWCLRKALFFRKNVGGYDERLSGCYGTSSEFTYRLQAAASAQITVEDPIVRYPREVITDASTSPDVYTRKGDENNDAELKARKNARNLLGKWKPLRGLTPWEEIPREADHA